MEKNKNFLYGNEKLLSFFKGAYENGKMAHAYIIEGGRGSGKHTLARRLACLLACRSFMDRPCFMCESCRKISEGISPDVIEVGLNGDKKTIGVDQIRDIRSDVYVKPTEEDVKIYIISNAELITPQAQNVFLKVLEEPPKGVFFLMLCENTANILPTVKSRAPVLKMQVFSDSELSSYLLENSNSARLLKGASPDEFELIVRIAEGKIGEAERLIADTKTDRSQSKHEKARMLIELSADSCSFSDLLVFVHGMVKTRDEFSDILLYAMYAARDLIAVKKTKDDTDLLLFYGDNDAARNTAAGFTAAGVMRIYDILCRAREELGLNTNLNNTLDYLACELKKAANC